MWVRANATGRMMPVDAAPDPLNGNVEVMPPAPDTPPEVPLEAVVHRQPPMHATGTMHLSHFATCPYAGEFRKRRRR